MDNNAMEIHFKWVSTVIIVLNFMDHIVQPAHNIVATHAPMVILYLLKQIMNIAFKIATRVIICLSKPVMHVKIITAIIAHFKQKEDLYALAVLLVGTEILYPKLAINVLKVALSVLTKLLVYLKVVSNKLDTFLIQLQIIVHFNAN